MDTQYIIAVSNASEEENDNSLSKFKNRLPKEFTCNGSYQIALQSIYLDNNFGNIPYGILNTSNHFIIHKSRNWDFDDDPEYSLTINRAVYTDKGLISLLRSGPNDKVGFGIVKKKLVIAISDRILLVHPEIIKFFILKNGEETKVINGLTYTVFDGLDRKKIVTSENEFLSLPIIPKFIKVKLNEMKQSLSVKNYHTDIAIIGNEKLDNTPFNYTVKRKEYFDIAPNILSTLSVTLTDEEDRQLLLVKGQPTILKFTIKKKTIMDSFILRVCSNDSNILFPDNINTNFRIELPQPLPSECLWDVALSSAFFPSRYNMRHILNKENFYIEFSPDDVTFTRITFDNVELTTKAIFQEINDRNDRVHMEIVENNDNDSFWMVFYKDTYLRMSKLFSYCLGKTYDTEINIFAEKEKTNLEFPNMNFDQSIPHAMFLYCNFVSPLIIGQQFSPILKIIPLEKNQGKDVIIKHDVEHLEYLPVSLNNRTTMEFTLRDPAGNLIKFENEKTPVFFNLIFRERM
jgi:hypothetical protein